jgi:hypothetical protein
MEQCANCGRSDLLQPDVANLQCLACGSLTSIETGQVVVPGEKGPNLSNAGLPVVELSHGVVEADANEYVTPVDGPDPEPEAVEEEVVAPRPARVDESYVPAEETTEVSEPAVEPVVEPVTEPESVMGPADIDLSQLTPEQIAAIEAIAHPEVS